jgi:hypothetical protein
MHSYGKLRNILNGMVSTKVFHGSLKYTKMFHENFIASIITSGGTILLHIILYVMCEKNISMCLNFN